ncbi:hypothetical protein [Nitrolancea hollandica]|uniref:Uncharacterized protein n=1 Tax=Nitrolancea hollandica Lb TaxID=1129897 RepID=I4EK61_9BACT|nr:hypothetical protein [Nitrolancea hollandica]CCF85073.1 conserved exported hypothetical protein [Nitrolancea hollandica Lb]
MRRWWLAGGGGLGLLMVVTLLLGTAGGLGSVASAETADDAAQLRELAERLLTYRGELGGQPVAVELLPGQAPSHPGLDLPAPEGSRLIGSVVYRDGDKAARLDKVLDVPGSAQDNFTFYQDMLKKRGWNVGSENQQGGFQPSTSSFTRFFCPEQGDSWLTLSISPRDDAPNDVRIHLDLTNPGPCDPSGHRPPGVAGPEDNIPALYAPDGVQVRPTGGSGGGGPYARSASSAVAETDKSPADIEAAFAQQLEAAGWKRVAGASEGPLAWSTWAVPGDSGDQGFLYALQATGKNRLNLYVQVESGSESSSGPSSGWSSSAVTALSAN